MHKKSRQKTKKKKIQQKCTRTRTIKGQEQRFRRLLHMLWMSNGKNAPWHSPSMLRHEMRKARMRNISKSAREKWHSGRYIPVETWVQDVLKYVDDSGDQRKSPRRMRIIYPFWISEVIGCFVVQVWMARVLGETKKRHEGIERDLMWGQTQ